jgi:hypothetical protein
MSFRSFCAALAALGLLNFCSLVQADVIYRETFGRPDPASGNLGPQLFDWARWNAAGGVGSTTSGVSSDGVGKPTDLANTASAGPHHDGTFNAYAEGWSFQDGTLRLSMTPEFAFDPANYTAGSIVFSWQQGNALISGSHQNIKLAVRAGGTWYVTNQNFVNTTAVGSGANFGNPDDGSATAGAQPMSYTYDPAAANWLLLNFDGTYDASTDTAVAATTALSIGAAAPADLSGPITAFGFYRDLTGANFRFDTFQIDAIPVPEPATWALGVMAGCLLLLRRRIAC